MKLIPTDLPDVKLIEPLVFGDERGFFLESYHKAKIDALLGQELTFVQDNHSFSLKGVLRGLHYQLENTQGKLIRMLSGEVFDVAVDMRRSSLPSGNGLVSDFRLKTNCLHGSLPALPTAFSSSPTARTSSTNAPTTTTPKRIAALSGTILPSALSGRARSTTAPLP